MIIEQSVKIRKYKCFDDVEQGFDKIFPINLIVGKNNSGKSSLIDLIDYLVSPKDSFLLVGRDKIRTEVIIGDTLNQEVIDTAFGLGSITHTDWTKLANQKIKYRLLSYKDIYHWENPPTDYKKDQIPLIARLLQTPLSAKNFLRITAERDIVAESLDTTKNQVLPNGSGATNIIRQIVTNALFDQDIVTVNLLDALNEILSPDIQFKNIYPRELNNLWEIYLQDQHGTLVPLSKMGSGIKTILLVLINLLVIPEINDTQKNSLVFGFEELENNLHPSLQRRLFNFISNYSKTNDCYFFITTHSSIIIDLFGSNANSQIVHVLNHGTHSTSKTVLTQTDGRNILKDLDFKASDLLMSNGIIWVEGPSDVIYIELFLELNRRAGSSVDKKKYDYSIQSLATATWKYAGFIDFDWNDITNEIENRIISLEKMNLNHLLVIDGDNNYENKKPSEWNDFKNGSGKNKARLIHESLKYSEHTESDLETNFGDAKNNKLFFWISDGTFESYLEYFIMNKGKAEFEKYFDTKKQRGFFEKKREGDKSSKSKVELASEIAKFCLENEIILDDIAPISSEIRNKIERLENTIKSWN